MLVVFLAGPRESIQVSDVFDQLKKKKLIFFRVDPLQLTLHPLRITLYLRDPKLPALYPGFEPQPLGVFPIFDFFPRGAGGPSPPL